MERRSPTGIARERETRTNNAAPHMERRPSPGGGLRPASRVSAKPAPTTLRPDLMAQRRPAARGGADQRSAFPWCAVLRPASRAHHMERRSPERETRTNNAAPYRLEWRTPCSIRTAPLAPLRGAVPTRGRRSLAGASLVLNQDCAARPAARGGADQRSAFPCLRATCAQSGLRRSPRCAGRCRPEVGVPLPARRLCSIRTAPLAPLRGAVPTRGRRSLACAPLVLNQDCAARPAARGGADQRSAFPCRRVACAQSGLRRPPASRQRCRPEVGVPLPARHRARGGYPPRCVARRLASRSEGERGRWPPFHTFPRNCGQRTEFAAVGFLLGRGCAVCFHGTRGRERWPVLPVGAFTPAPLRDAQRRRAQPPAQNRGDCLERRPLGSSPGGARHSPPKAGGRERPNPAELRASR